MLVSEPFPRDDNQSAHEGVREHVPRRRTCEKADLLAMDCRARVGTAIDERQLDVLELSPGPRDGWLTEDDQPRS
jgi:hypothetical protein